MARRFASAADAAAPSGGAGSVSMWDNAAFPAARVSLNEFERLSALSNKAADEHAATLRQRAREEAAAAATRGAAGGRSKAAVGGVEAHADEARRDGRLEGLLVGSAVGAIGGGGSVALHAAVVMHAPLAAACTIS